MRRRTLALLMAGPVVLAAVAGALVLVDPIGSASAASDEADHVTLYQNGLAFVRFNRTFESSGGEATRLVLSLPQTARAETVAIHGEGVVVEQLRSSIADGASLRVGDQVIVHTQDGPSVEGTFVGMQEGRLVVSAPGGTTLVERQHVVAIEVERPAALDNRTAAGQALVEAIVRAPAGEHEVQVSYLADGAGWTPSYRFDVQTGELAFFASLTAPADWEDVRLDLVAGAPNLVRQPHPPIPMAARPVLEESASAAAGDVFRPSEPLGELHAFRLQAPVDLTKGETVRLLVEQGQLDVLRRYHEVEASVGRIVIPAHDLDERDVPVQQRVMVENSLQEPLPPGVVNAYRNGTWIGQDELPAMPPGDVANLTLAAAQDVDARLVAQSQNATGATDTVTWALHVENLKDEAIDLRAAITFPVERTRLVDAQPDPAQVRAGEVVWNADVQAGETETFELTLATQHERAVAVEPAPRPPSPPPR